MGSGESRGSGAAITWVLLAAAIGCEVTATLALKGALDLPVLYVVVVLGYVAAFVLLAAVLRRGMGLGVAYGIWGALGVAATAVLSAMVFDEALTLVMVIGLGLIVAGVVLVEGGSQVALARRRLAEAVADQGSGQGSGQGSDQGSGQGSGERR